MQHRNLDIIQQEDAEMFSLRLFIDLKYNKKPQNLHKWHTNTKK